MRFVVPVIAAAAAVVSAAPAQAALWFVTGFGEGTGSACQTERFVPGAPVRCDRSNVDVSFGVIAQEPGSADPLFDPAYIDDDRFSLSAGEFGALFQFDGTTGLSQRGSPGTGTFLYLFSFRDFSSRYTGTFRYNITAFTGQAEFGPTMTSVPEPVTWAMMIGGFALVGTSLRRARQKPSALAL